MGCSGLSTFSDRLAMCVAAMGQSEINDPAPAGHLAYNRAGYLHRQIMGFFFDGIGTVMSRAALMRLYFGIRDKVEDVASFQTNILNTQVTGHLVTDIPQTILEFCIHFSFLVTQEEIFKRIKESVLHFLYVLVIGEQQGELLFVHQYTGRNRCCQVIAIINQFGKHGNIFFLQRFDRLEVAKLQLGHTTAGFLWH